VKNANDKPWPPQVLPQPISTTLVTRDRLADAVSLGIESPRFKPESKLNGVLEELKKDYIKQFGGNLTGYTFYFSSPDVVHGNFVRLGDGTDGTVFNPTIRQTLRQENKTIHFIGVPPPADGQPQQQQ